MTTVSVLIPCRNEMARLPLVIDRLNEQTLAADEIVVSDGCSTDGSYEWLLALAERDPRVRVVRNEAKVVPNALNVGLAQCTGEFVARMDTHADYAVDYLERVVAFLAAHPEAAGVGGAMATEGTGDWGKAIAATLSRPWGLGGARHRVGGEPGPIVHVFSGCYRREALLAIGGWDERLLANEDFEADLRVAATGKPVFLEPSAQSTWYVRKSPRALAKQMWRYGYYKGLTLHLHPDALQPRQLAPLALVVGLTVGAFTKPRPTAAVAAAYLAATAFLGARAAKADGASPARGAVVPAIVHASWGSGLLVGLVRFARLGRRPAQPPAQLSDTSSDRRNSVPARGDQE